MSSPTRSSPIIVEHLDMICSARPATLVDAESDLSRILRPLCGSRRKGLDRTALMERKRSFCRCPSSPNRAQTASADKQCVAR